MALSSAQCAYAGAAVREGVQQASLARPSPGDGMSAGSKPRRSGAATIEIELYGARIHLRGGADRNASIEVPLPCRKQDAFQRVV